VKRNELVALLVAIAAVVGAVAIAFAVGGGSNDGIPPSALTAGEWRDRVNEICADIGPRAKAIPRPKEEDKVADFTAAVVPLWDRERTEIRELGLPEGLETGTRDLLTAMDYLNAALLEIHIATQRYDGVRRFYAVQKSRDAARTIKFHSQAMGLDACAAQRIP
jgi:hypothetical protein